MLQFVRAYQGIGNELSTCGIRRILQHSISLKGGVNFASQQVQTSSNFPTASSP